MFLNVDNAKFLVNLTVKSVAAKATSDVIVSNTELDEDAMRVKIGSIVAGLAVGNATKPHTDKAVEKINDWRIARKNAKLTEQQ